MKRQIEVIYDGQVLHPQEPLDLEPNTRLSITIEASMPQQSPVDRLLRLAGTAASEPVDEMLAFLDQARTISPLS